MHRTFDAIISINGSTFWYQLPGNGVLHVTNYNEWVFDFEHDLRILDTRTIDDVSYGYDRYGYFHIGNTYIDAIVSEEAGHIITGVLNGTHA